MHTENLVVCALIIDDSCQWKVLKHVIKLLENTIGIIDIFTKASIALLTQSQVFVDVAIFVVTTQHEDLLGVFELKSHQKTDNFQTLATFINVVTQEKVIKTTDVTRFTWGAPDIQESHQIDVVTMDVAKNLDWRLQLLNYDWLLLKDVSALIDQFRNLFSFLSKALESSDLLLAILWL